jgi:hypothetical protein
LSDNMGWKYVAVEECSWSRSCMLCSFSALYLCQLQIWIFRTWACVPFISVCSSMMKKGNVLQAYSWN